MKAGTKPLLEVCNLRVDYATRVGHLRAVDALSFSIQPGETVALVGESGCGKSTAGLALMRLSSSPQARIDADQLMFEGEDLLKLTPEKMRMLRGSRIAMIFQDPSMYLNPVHSVGQQISESIRLHEPGVDDETVHHRAIELLRLVGIPAPQERVAQYPHNLSGGMRQRLLIAMALACKPKLLIADEPTTALDVTIQAQVLALIRDLKVQLGMAVLLITHDLGVVAETADRMIVMYAGRKVEEGTVKELFSHPVHPYTKGLIRAAQWSKQEDGTFFEIPGAVPSLLTRPSGCNFASRCPSVTEECRKSRPAFIFGGLGRGAECFLAMLPPHDETVILTSSHQAKTETHSDMMHEHSNAQLLLEVRGLGMRYPMGNGWFGKRKLILALENVSFDINVGETLAVVGESGCGKSTLGKSILRLIEPTSGEVLLDGEIFSGAGILPSSRMRQKMQVIFQDPYASLNPRRTIFQSVADPLRESGITSLTELKARVRETLNHVGLYQDFMDRHPHELSGGQRQRVAIARAIVMRPRLVICDEPISSLDISIQAQVINLLRRLQKELGIAYIFITHDLRLVPQIANQVLVMYLGQVVEQGPAKLIAQQRLHPYSQSLFSAAPRADLHDRSNLRIVLEGEVPSPMDPPNGCRFHTRCPIRQQRCSEEEPELRLIAGRSVRCHFAEAPVNFKENV